MRPTVLLAAVLLAPGALAHEHVPGTEEGFPLVRYDGGFTSVNDRCPVRSVQLNDRLDPVFVNGEAVGFC